MCELLRPTVYKYVCDYAFELGILKPNILVTPASKNGDSYSGEVYRITITDTLDDDGDGCSKYN